MEAEQGAIAPKMTLLFPFQYSFEIHDFHTCKTVHNINKRTRPMAFAKVNVFFENQMAMLS